MPDAARLGAGPAPQAFSLSRDKIGRPTLRALCENPLPDALSASADYVVALNPLAVSCDSRSNSAMLGPLKFSFAAFVSEDLCRLS